MFNFGKKIKESIGVGSISTVVNLLGANDPKKVKPFLQEQIPKIEPMILDYVMTEQKKIGSKLVIIAQVKNNRVQIDIVKPQRDGSFLPHKSFNMDEFNNENIDNITQRIITGINEFTK